RNSRWSLRVPRLVSCEAENIIIDAEQRVRVIRLSFHAHSGRCRHSDLIAVKSTCKQFRTRNPARNKGMPEKDSTTQTATHIDSVLQEQRRFECPEHFRQQAHIKTLDEYEGIYRESVEQPEKFWGRIADELHWFKKWDKVLEWNYPWAKWFAGGQFNL